jgi:SAM-dependent methyltransferase
MSREIPYEAQTLDHPNPIARFAHQKRYSNSLRLVRSLLPPSGTILDFGAGQGEMLHQLGILRPDAQLLAFEPYMQLKYPEITLTKAMEEIADSSADVVGAFETLEHITDQQLDHFIAQAKRICRANGRIVISVPVMQGAALPIKQIVRSILFRRYSDYSIGEMIRGTFGLHVDRTSTILLSHKGFDHRALCRRLSSELILTQSFCSPFGGLPWWVNSQAFFVFAKRA